MQREIFYMVYISLANTIFGQEELRVLLERSRHNNSTSGITGMLLYTEFKFRTRTEARFIQFLEGDQAAVNTVYERIKADSRHGGLITLRSGTAPERSFEGWSMGFSPLPESEIPEGYFDPSDTFPGEQNGDRSASAMSLLKSFYRINTLNNDSGIPADT
jgi:hypothetical protein